MNKIPLLNKSTIAIAVAQALVVNTSSALIINVDSGADDGSGGLCTLREAIDSLNGGMAVGGCSSSGGMIGVDDTIIFDATVSSVTVVGSELPITTDMVINPDGDLVTIQIDDSANAFDIIDSIVTFHSLSISGGGIDSNNSTVTLNNSLVSNSNSTSNIRGGGILAQSGVVTLNNSEVSNNFASSGGGIYGISSTININNSTVSNNSATGDAGGIHTVYFASININDSTVSNNTSGASGGGVFASIISLNNSVVSNNTSTSFGGGLLLNGGTITNSTISGNLAYQKGGGIYNDSGATLGNSIIAGNFDSGYGAEIYGNVNSSSSLIGSGTNAYSGFTPDPSDIIVNLDQVSLSTVLLPLADNGGPTLTHALPETSPAINAGDNAVCADSPIDNLDQRGEPRPFGTNCDIGSVESPFEEPKPIDDTSLFVVPLPNGKSAIFGL